MASKPNIHKRVKLFLIVIKSQLSFLTCYFINFNCTFPKVFKE